MGLFRRCLRRSKLFLPILFAVSFFCKAQVKSQFTQPTVEPTNGIVSSFLPGNFETVGTVGLLYVDAATASGGSFQVTAGQLLNQPSYLDLTQNRIVFSNTLAVSVALGDFNADGHPDFAFALSPTTSTGSDLCVYYGTGLGAVYPGAYALNESGCLSFPIHGSNLPSFTYIAAVPFRNFGPPQLILEDSNNGYLYLVANTGAVGVNGLLPGFSVKAAYAIPPADGPGPIYTGDFNNDGIPDFIVNNQASLSASIYFGNGDGTFQPPIKVGGTGNVHSMLLHDMDGDGIADLVVEGDSGVITIHLGNGSNTPAPFAVGSVGGTLPLQNGLSGNGGHIAAIGYLGAHNILSILTTTPIGLSVLQQEGAGVQSYRLAGIYNIGPGRSAFALADFNGDGIADLAVDSPQGVAIVLGNSDGSFQTSIAYSAGQPALNATVGRFRNNTNNPKGNLDVVVATAATQAQLLTGNGDGTFNALAAPVNSSASPGNTIFDTILSGAWSNILPGDFNGDGNLDILYSLTGLPSTVPSIYGGYLILYAQYGNGDGTFGQSGAPFSLAKSVGNNVDGYFGESAIGDFNGDGMSDIGYGNQLGDFVGLGAPGVQASYLSQLSNQNVIKTRFNSVGAGFFKVGRTNKQDLVFQEGVNLVPYVNSGDGINFTAKPALASPPPIGSFYPASILIADMDHDGCGDIVVPYHNLAANPGVPNPNLPNQIYVWYGNCDGTFSDPPVITTLSRNHYLAASADMNGDGLPDLILSDGFILAILYNQGNRTFNGEQDFLAGQGINSISVADVNGDGSPDLIVANGGATISSAVAIGGLTLPSISLTPNPDVNTGGITVLLNQISTKAVTGTLAASPDPSLAGASFTLTATITPSAGVAIPTGTVQFAINGVNVGAPVSVVPGATFATAVYTVAAGNPYAAGMTYPITASYSGDFFNSPVVLHATQAITGITTTTTLILCIGGSSPGCPVTGAPTGLTYVPSLTMYYGQVFNGTEAAAASDNSALTGTLSFYQDGVDLCDLPASGPATCPPSVGTGTPVGTHVFVSEYSGDASHLASTSLPVTITVLQDTTTASIASSLNPALQGQPVTFTATFTGSYAPPTGSVQFTYYLPGSPATPIALGTVMLTPGAGLSGTAVFTTSSLPVGADTVFATYANTQNFAGSGAFLTETILPVATTTTTLTSSVNPSALGQSVTFTATVTTSASSGTPPTPAGTITFLDGTTILGTGTLTATSGATATATFTTSALAIGGHSITASYPASASIGGSVSPVLVQVVNNSSFTLTVTPTPVSLAAGNAVTLTVTVTPVGGFNQTVTLGCASLPNESTCTFAAPTLGPGSYTTTLLLTTMAPHNCGSTQPYFTGRNPPAPGSNSSPIAPLAIPALAGLVGLCFPGRRRWLRCLIAVAGVAVAMQITGCGNCTDLGTRPNTYTFQVNGTASGTTEIESQSVTITITL
jgi:hypothetical protein